MVGACAGYGVQTNTHTVTFLYSTNYCAYDGGEVQPFGVAYVYNPISGAGGRVACNPNPIGTNINPFVSADRVSSALLFSEAMTNFAGTRELYVHSGTLATAGGVTAGYTALNTNRPTGVLATNIVTIALADCPDVCACANFPLCTTNLWGSYTVTRWILNGEWRLSPTPTWEWWLVPDWRSTFGSGPPFNDVRPVETNYNVTTYALVPYWNGTEHGLGFDETNNLGYWQRAASNGSAGSDISFPTFISTNIPTIGGQNREEVEAIDAAKVLIKWDATTNGGFRYHQ
jgi:hypothetical protein